MPAPDLRRGEFRGSLRRHLVREIRGVAKSALNALPARHQDSIRRHRNRSRPLPAMSIGLLVGNTPWDLTTEEHPGGLILTAADVTDVPAAFVADPFAIKRGETWHLFFEVMNRLSGKGEIATARSTDLTHWTYDGIALTEPFHLSYPGVYLEGGEIWMIPETWEAGHVRLYRADPFPMRWKLERVLIDGCAVTDPTLFMEDGGNWSMLACAADGAHNETLLRFGAPHLTGPWHAAAENPLLEACPESARPGGHCFSFKGVRYRLGQDCSRRYGERLRSFPLEPPWGSGGRTVVTASGDSWRSKGGHHADIHETADGRLLAFVDGES